MRKQSRDSQAGYSIVEVLVALVITTLSLLGLGSLQLSSVRNTNSAAQRLEATTLAYDILERMRANRRQALLGNYDIDLDQDPAGAGLAFDDLGDWKDALTQLPGGDGAVEVIGEQEVTITVQWTDAVDDGRGGTSEVHLRTAL